MRRDGKVRIATACVVLALAGSAFAYVLPGGSILRRVASKRDDVSGSAVKVEGSATFFGNGMKEAAVALNLPADKPELALDASFAIKFPSRCRFELSSPEGGRAVVALNNGKKRAEGTEVTAAVTALQQVCALLALRSSSDSETRAQMDRHLRGLGVELQKTSLGRFGGKVAYVLGNPDAGSPQFWVYKDSFLPARVMFGDWDVKLIDYSSAATGETFPRMVEVYRGQELQLRFTGSKSDSRALSDRLF